MYKNLKAMIVDDSNFSMKLLTNQLTNLGFEVATTAFTVGDAISKAREFTPDLITMDITLPDGDGLECAKKILSERPDANIIIISSTKDSKLSKIASDIGAMAFLQKPISDSEFSAVLESIFNKADAQTQLFDCYGDIFANAIEKILHRAINSPIEISSSTQKPQDIKSSGVSVSIGINGINKGRMIVDTSMKTAIDISSKSYGDTDILTDEETIDYWSDITNVIAGHAISAMNEVNDEFNLKLTPPTLFKSDDLSFVAGEIKSTAYNVNTEFGSIYVNAGFVKGGK